MCIYIYMYTYIYIYIHTYICIYIFIYIYTHTYDGHHEGALEFVSVLEAQHVDSQGENLSHWTNVAYFVAPLPPQRGSLIVQLARRDYCRCI